MILSRWLVTLQVTDHRLARLRPRNVHSLLSSWLDARPEPEGADATMPRGSGHQEPQHYCLSGSLVREGDIVHMPVGVAGGELSEVLRERIRFGPVQRYSKKRACVVPDETLEVVGLRLLGRTTLDEIWASGHGVTGWNVRFLRPTINRRYRTDYECLSGFEKVVGKGHRAILDPVLGAAVDPAVATMVTELTPARMADQVILVNQKLWTTVTENVQWADEAPETKSVPGTVGQIEWRIRRGKDPRPLHAALMLGEYVGVGTRTSYGFGAVRVTPLTNGGTRSGANPR